jgi:RNA polymerase sigma-70 factor (ECF subfamily)
MSLAAPSSLSFRTLYEEHSAFVRRSLGGLGVSDADLDDVCHEVFLVVHARLDLFRALDGARPWLYEVCRRTASAHRRRAFRREEIPAEDPVAWTAEPLTPEPEETDGRMLAAMERLAPDRREVLLYGDLVDVSVSDLAVLLDCDRKTARKRLLAARRRMARLLDAPDAFDRPPPGDDTVMSPALFDRARVRLPPGTLGDEAPPFRVVTATPHFAAAICGRAFMTVWRRAAPEEIDLLTACATDAFHSRGGTFAYLAIVESSCAPPNAASRKRLIEIVASARPYVSSYVSVLGGGPSAFVVPIMNVIFHLVQAPFPVRFFRETSDAAAWSVKRSHLALAPTTLERALNTLHQAGL